MALMNVYFSDDTFKFVWLESRQQRKEGVISLVDNGLC